MNRFCEGLVTRVDLAAPEGRFFVVEVMNEVILDREHRIRPSFEEIRSLRVPERFSRSD